MQKSACDTERMEIPFQCCLRQRAHSFRAWANAVRSGLRDHSCPETLFCRQSILVADLGEHLMMLAQQLGYSSMKQKASVQTSIRQRRGFSLCLPHSDESFIWIPGMGLLLYLQHDSWCLAAEKNGDVGSLFLTVCF